ncbi:MAG: DeoR/GlpR family DNA-binding transcription regulator [Faecalimonas sp.]|nr:DeoR/GlpR family DNA-binding transcription regulator [Faecalimonas sp.]
MLAIERRNAILEKLQAERRVVVSELSILYDVSEETIRRDLEKLENEGYVIKSYGGAVLNENANLDLPFNIRKNKNVVGKQKIADIISQTIHDGDFIFLDASSTAVAIAKNIKGKKGLTIITNSLEIAIELLDVPDCKVISTGGEIVSTAFGLVGHVTDKTIRSYYVDKAIISSKGFDLEKGFTDSDERHANNKRSMLESARVKILAIDSSKFDRVSFAKIGDLRDVTMIVTDAKPEDKWLKKFAEFNVECIYPE